MLDRNHMIAALAESAEKGGKKHGEMMAERKRLHDMSLTDLAEEYRKVLKTDPYTALPVLDQAGAIGAH